MRILVTSDTHRDEFALRSAVLRQPKADVVIHLGDGEEDVAAVKMSFPGKMFLQVRGNCDWGSTLPSVGEITLEGRKIFYTHGHLYNVKYGGYAGAAEKHDVVTGVCQFFQSADGVVHTVPPFLL